MQLCLCRGVAQMLHQHGDATCCGDDVGERRVVSQVCDSGDCCGCIVVQVPQQSKSDTPRSSEFAALPPVSTGVKVFTFEPRASRSMVSHERGHDPPRVRVNLPLRI